MLAVPFFAGRFVSYACAFAGGSVVANLFDIESAAEHKLVLSNSMLEFHTRDPIAALSKNFKPGIGPVPDFTPRGSCGKPGAQTNPRRRAVPASVTGGIEA